MEKDENNREVNVFFRKQISDAKAPMPRNRWGDTAMHRFDGLRMKWRFYPTGGVDRAPQSGPNKEGDVSRDTGWEFGSRRVSFIHGVFPHWS